MAPTGSAPPSTGSVQLRSSGYEVQLFADAVAAGVHPAEQVQRAAAHGLSGSGSTLPHLTAIQQSFGRHDVSAVQAHVGGRAAEGAAAMGAHGYAAGNAVAFANTPDLHLAAHEAAHVVQQRAGVHLKGGVGEVGDSYERHADAVADLVVQGKSAESLLDQMAPAGAVGGGGVQQLAIQRREIVEHDAAHIRERLSTLERLASPSERNHLIASLRAVANGDARTLSFFIGADHYQLDIARDTASAIVSSLDHLRTTEHHGGRATPSGFTRLLGRLISVCAANEGSGLATVELEVPTGEDNVIISFGVHVANHEGRYEVGADIQLGASVGMSDVFEIRALAGLHAQAVGNTAEHAAELLFVGIRSAARDLAPDVAGYVFDGVAPPTGPRSAEQRDLAAVGDGESTDASTSATLGVRVGDEDSAHLEATAGVSEHHRIRGTAQGGVAQDLAVWDFTGELRLPFGEDQYLSGEIQAHIPNDPAERMELSIRLSGAVRLSQQGFIATSAIEGLQTLISHFSEASEGPNRDEAVSQGQRILASLHRIGEAPAHALFAGILHEEPVGYELEISGRADGSSEIVVRSTTHIPTPSLPHVPGVGIHVEIESEREVFRTELSEARSTTPAPAGMCTPDAQEGQ